MEVENMEVETVISVYHPFTGIIVKKIPVKYFKYPNKLTKIFIHPEPNNPSLEYWVEYLDR